MTDFTREEINKIVEGRPWAALEHASSLLPPEQFDYCVEEEPWAALKFAAHLLSPEQKKYCEENI